MRNSTQERGRAIATIVSLVVVAIVYWPVHQNWSDSPVDDFPLSYYPMFTSQRSSKMTIYHAVGRTQDGDTVNLPGKLAGAGGLNTVRKQMRKMCQNGRADELAAKVAERLAGSRLASQHKIMAVEVVKSRYALESCIAESVDPVSREVLATHPVQKEMKY